MFVPWVPSYSRKQAEAAIRAADTWREALDSLGLRYHGKAIQTLRKWAVRWKISTEHLGVRTVPRHRYTEAEARAAISASRSWAETLRRLGYCQSGANPKTLKKRVAEWGISTEHFDPSAAVREAHRGPRKSLEEILVEHSTYSRSNLKQRLYRAGLKAKCCELCGQGELWRGRRMGLILDHVNGVRDDNRLENLRIVCPNCTATLDTHCGRRLRPRRCSVCDELFSPRDGTQLFCSMQCWANEQRRRGKERVGRAQPQLRRVDRPPFELLLDEVRSLGYLAVGRKYGVSDNAIRKWVRQYERERALADGRDPTVVSIPTRTWPNRRDKAA